MRHAAGPFAGLWTRSQGRNGNPPRELPCPGLNKRPRRVSNGVKMSPNPFVRVVIPALLLITAGCVSTPAQRVAGSASFDTYPSAVQGKILNSEVDVGFTQDMVRLALGRPDRVSRMQTVEGDSEVWTYDERRLRVGFSFGIAGGGGSTRTGAGASVGGRDWDTDVKTRVIFEGGVVSAVEKRVS